MRGLSSSWKNLEHWLEVGGTGSFSYSTAWPRDIIYNYSFYFYSVSPFALTCAYMSFMGRSLKVLLALLVSTLFKLHFSLHSTKRKTSFLCNLPTMFQTLPFQPRETEYSPRFSGSFLLAQGSFYPDSAIWINTELPRPYSFSQITYIERHLVFVLDLRSSGQLDRLPANDSGVECSSAREVVEERWV